MIILKGCKFNCAFICYFGIAKNIDFNDISDVI